MDITQHRTDQDWMYRAVVLDAISRRVVVWFIADYLRTELVCDALETARWHRRPAAGQTVAHSDHGSQYTS
ncbi:DDE-type integrase/transposase/recombinase [Catenulispora sp. NL8]|uniref:DDE-type integrase/transposase/recombinase n=1 Tax=Catenulispora pinistramenti TaxID=2705254 RepID=A0ABS5KGP9_9ACTN|nr:DDE-type integrase/transposase/recombinase [Catenulispora pinistramenti]MBS2545476.1 DDE-type integrase/transposase/recombinase [Catenulispora pinistramenti]